MPLIDDHASYVPSITNKGNDMNIYDGQPRAARRHIWRIIGWGGAVTLILTPLLAMQFTSEVNWDETDFIFAAIIFGIVGGLIELAVRLSSNWYFRSGAIFAVIAGFMLVWCNLAVGMIGNEDNPVNLWFAAVLLIAILGAILSRFHRRAMAFAMFAAGTAQVAIGLFAGILGADMRGGILTVILAILWIIAGTLHLMASERIAQR
jgi:MFS family permease